MNWGVLAVLIAAAALVAWLAILCAADGLRHRRQRRRTTPRHPPFAGKRYPSKAGDLE